MLRGCNAEEDVRFKDGAGKVGGDLDVDGEREAGEVGKIFSCVGKLFGECDGV
jgi:hypothetical protein